MRESVIPEEILDKSLTNFCGRPIHFPMWSVNQLCERQSLDLIVNEGTPSLLARTHLKL